MFVNSIGSHIRNSFLYRFCFLFIISLLIVEPAFSQVNTNGSFTEGKARINNLIKRIEQGADKRVLKTIERGEGLTVTSLNNEQQITVTKKENKIYFVADNCTKISEVNSWDVSFHPLKITTTPEESLSWQLKNNATLLGGKPSPKCMSYIDLPDKAGFKVSGNKRVGSTQHWSFEKYLSSEAEYFSVNTPESPNALAPKGVAVCKLSSAMCYSNDNRATYLGALTKRGVKKKGPSLQSGDTFYLEARHTLNEINQKYSNFNVEELQPTRSIITKFISKNIDNIIIVSVRDRAKRSLSKADVLELKQLGVNLSELSLRGSHVTILRPGEAPFSITDNRKSIKLTADDHNVRNVDAIISAGNLAGNESVITFKGKNVSANKRGLNIAVISVSGKLIETKNFDTHRSSYRREGLYRVSAG